MWDPEKGSVLGEDVRLMNYRNLTAKNQTAQIGTTAFLHCKVRKMTDKKISWIRRRDNHVLTAGLVTYSNDDRFNVVRNDEANDWSLQIKFIQTRDQGTYECQVCLTLCYVG
ncbi:UNVERIFIED_CONTAM: hypothetical protein RMT77_014954 [Armadillidium vulgare]